MKMKRKMDGHNYCIYTNNTNYVKVGSTYAKKPVYGYAKLNGEEDKFDLEKGIQLAKARCDVSITRKRIKELHNKIDEVNFIIDDLQNYLTDLLAYETEAHARFLQEEQNLIDILKEL